MKGVDGLQGYLPPLAALALERELFEHRRHGRELDEPTLRYVWACILERFGLECPHPYRDELSDYRPGAFMCRLCRCTWVPNLTDHSAQCTPPRSGRNPPIV